MKGKGRKKNVQKKNQHFIISLTKKFALVCLYVHNTRIIIRGKGRWRFAGRTFYKGIRIHIP